MTAVSLALQITSSWECCHSEKNGTLLKHFFKPVYNHLEGVTVKQILHQQPGFLCFNPFTTSAGGQSFLTPKFGGQNFARLLDKTGLEWPHPHYFTPVIHSLFYVQDVVVSQWRNCAEKIKLLCSVGTIRR